MKRFLLTTVAALALTGPALAQDLTTNVDTSVSATVGDQSLSADVSGAVDATVDGLSDAATSVGDAVSDAVDATAAAASDMAASVEAKFQAMTTADIDLEGFSAAASTDITAEALLGLPVNSPSNDYLGDIGDIVLGADGTIDAVILDVGGFLGIGEKPVAVAFEDLIIFKAEDSMEIRAFLGATAEILDAMPAYEG